ncbi:type 2 isopentenyl-diphosphate Delta-isomerase [bacterium I07]|nr:type 2 isopentenyl-diphosphate Delta-isomerase [bacterium I07]
MTISRRKGEHLRIAVKKDVGFKDKKTGFEKYDFTHCALPELDLDEVKTEIRFLGRRLHFPLMVSAMTGGCADAAKINRQLAEVCRDEKVGLGVGSQRQILESSDHVDTFRIVRQLMPGGLIVGNIGAAQVSRGELDTVQGMIDLIEADAMAVHLNPLHEALQPQGEPNFKNVLDGLERLVRKVEVPIIVKEIGCGISEEVARQLKGVGVHIIDIAGAGGTSWAAIESYRCTDKYLAGQFREWGIPTALSLEQVSRVDDIQIIASGGIDSGMVMAKALALGAACCGAALPILRILKKRKPEGLRRMMQEWKNELKTVMFLTGSRTVRDLRNRGVIYETL